MSRLTPLCLLPILLTGIAVSAPTALAQGQSLPVTSQAQETSEWCWAASGQMLMNLVGAAFRPPNVPQCYEANNEFGRNDCCTCPTPSACVQPGWPEFSKWGFNSNTTTWGTPLSWNDVKGQINAGKPFMFSWEWNGGGGHAMVAKGFQEIKLKVGPVQLDLQMVVVANPWPPQGRCGPGGNAAGPFGGDLEIITYSEFVGGAGYNHTHGADIYNIAHI